MQNLFSVSQLSEKEIYEILNLALLFKKKNEFSKHYKPNKIFKTKIVVNLFFEPSTRTQYSFEVAEHKLGIKSINFNTNNSSLLKKESFYDTVKTFDSLGVDCIVIRSGENKWYEQFENKLNAKLINAGDGICDHPTQTLLDLLTIYEEFKTFKGLKVLIVGDIIHSRVAHSNIEVMKRLGMEVYLSAPNEFQDKQYTYVDFDEYINKVDVINMLRIQNERLENNMKMSIDEYNKKFGLNNKKIKQLKQDTIIIHPAPVNRNVEIDDDVVECSHSRIFKQMENGVFVRMAVLSILLIS